MHASTAVEHAQMERLVRRQLIPYCYRAIALKPSTAVKSQLESFKQVGRTDSQSTSQFLPRGLTERSSLQLRLAQN